MVCLLFEMSMNGKDIGPPVNKNAATSSTASVASKKSNFNCASKGGNSTLSRSNRLKGVRSISQEAACSSKGSNSTLSGSNSLKGKPSRSISEEEDFELECTLALAEHINAAAELHIKECVIKKHMKCMDEKLALETDKVTKGLEKIGQQEELISKFELQLHLAKAQVAINKAYDNHVEFITSTDLPNNLQQVTKILLKLGNAIALKNVKPLEVQSDYDQMACLIDELNTTATNFKAGIGSLQNASVLTEEVKVFIDSQTELINTLEHLKALFDNVEYTILKKMSDEAIKNKDVPKKMSDEATKNKDVPK